MKNKKQMLRKIKRANVIEFRNYTNYDPSRIDNGGCSLYTHRYTRIGKTEQFKKSYHISSDFAYCPVCGQFGDHYDWNTGKYSCGKFEIISEAQLTRICMNFEESEAFTMPWSGGWKRTSIPGSRKKTRNS